MAITNTEAYRTALVEYLSRGIPPRLPLKQAGIADEGRANRAGPLSCDFGAPYDFGDVAFSHGDDVARGAFVGRVDDCGAMLWINGAAPFKFRDSFEDPLDIGIEAGGIPYPITGNWTARFSAEVMKDVGGSQYGAVNGR